MFGGIGGLRRALELIGLFSQGIVFIDNNPTCAKLAKKHCAFVLTVEDVNKITKETVGDWRIQFATATRVIIGGGWPCANHSRLNSQREGADAASSQLLDPVLQVTEWLRKQAPAAA